MDYKYYYLYQIINKINGKIYIGVHQTDNIDDGYMGSGTHLIRAQKKYGLVNFTKEVLRTFDSEEDMYLEEAELVDKEFVLREDTYNLTEGGKGWTLIASSRGGKLGGKLGGKINGKYIYENNLGCFSKKGKENLRKYLISEENLNNLSRIKNSEKIKQKRKETYKLIKHQQGEKNSQYGTMWITNGKESVRIKKDEPIHNKWHKGRKIKKEGLI